MIINSLNNNAFNSITDGLLNSLALTLNKLHLLKMFGQEEETLDLQFNTLLEVYKLETWFSCNINTIMMAHFKIYQ